MKKPVSSKLYQRIEWHLHNRKQLEANLRNARDDILHGSTPREPGIPNGHRRHADPTAIKGCLLLSASIEDLERWIDVIDQTHAYFSDTQEGRMAAYFYGQNVTAQAVAKKLGITWRSVLYLRNTFVYRCVMNAIVAGVVNLDDWQESIDE